MVVISKSKHVTTLINEFTVSPENQDKLVHMLVEATERTMKFVPGFVSASIHKTADGVHVVNYAQWKNRNDFEAMRDNPKAQAHMQPIMEIAQADFHLYEVVGSYQMP